jgi:hypothetical protein
MKARNYKKALLKTGLHVPFHALRPLPLGVEEA